jgi:hypothetical protein
MVGTVAWMLQAEGGAAMEAKIDEIGDSTYRLSIYVPKIYPPFGFTFNQFLILGKSHCSFTAG